MVHCVDGAISAHSTATWGRRPAINKTSYYSANTITTPIKSNIKAAEAILPSNCVYVIHAKCEYAFRLVAIQHNEV